VVDAASRGVLRTVCEYVHLESRRSALRSRFARGARCGNRHGLGASLHFGRPPFSRGSRVWRLATCPPSHEPCPFPPASVAASRKSAADFSFPECGVLTNAATPRFRGAMRAELLSVEDPHEPGVFQGARTWQNRATIVARFCHVVRVRFMGSRREISFRGILTPALPQGGEGMRSRRCLPGTRICVRPSAARRARRRRGEDFSSASIRVASLRIRRTTETLRR
jgi:hypothetical protein